MLSPNRILEKDKLLQGHLKVLRDKVFQIETKWPHFKLLLDDLVRLSEVIQSGKTIVAMERTLLYGGNSLIAPLFQNHEFISVDCSPETADERGAYNKNMVADEHFISIKSTRRGEETDTGLSHNCADVVLVPNLVHHVANQDKLFSEISRICKPGGLVYVFEPLVRELHQMPDDYLRYTPFGMMKIMGEKGLKAKPFRSEGGPFSVIAYCWTQALQYLPEDEREEKEEWFYNHHFRELSALDSKYQKNLMRPHTSFPMAFSIEAVKQK